MVTAASRPMGCGSSVCAWALSCSSYVPPFACGFPQESPLNNPDAANLRFALHRAFSKIGRCWFIWQVADRGRCAAFSVGIHRRSCGISPMSSLVLRVLGALATTSESRPRYSRRTPYRAAPRRHNQGMERTHLRLPVARQRLVYSSFSFCAAQCAVKTAHHPSSAVRR